MGNEITTIKINKKTKERLDNLKEFKGESYEEVLKKLLYILNLTKKNPLLGNKALNNIDKTIQRRKVYEKELVSEF